MPAELVSILNLKKSFAGRLVLAIDSLKICEKEILALTGPSGCGKSTLINLVAGYFLPDSGSITFNGQAISCPGPDRVPVLQKHTLLPWLTAYENVAFGLRKCEKDRRLIRAKAMEALEMVGMGEYASLYPEALSGGMAQRVALARALALNPSLLLLDEPFAALDEPNRAMLHKLLLATQAEKNFAVMLVTHNLAEALSLADRIAILQTPPQGLKKVHLIEESRELRASGHKNAWLEKVILQEIGSGNNQIIVK